VLVVANFEIAFGRVCEICRRTGHHARAKRGKLARAGDEVRVDVRFDGVRDGEALCLSRGNVLVDVPPRVHDNGLPRAFACEKIRALGEAFVEEAPEHALQSCG
jgi:hypothetical protein